ncbi:unnamed protein product [Didymodactylos carnosus]|uniref:Uncharacterized protein n=1 Tax=Didymodactylos carnosus TaxID=1234261 RepID=A0A8S2FI41_9BILA|nr:unnamed protein product [Didymodactylos carnosus]CAF4267630.1 unnamed protein product [Didymodactylos carnosus]
MNKLSSSSALATQSIPKKCKTKNRCNKLSKSDDAPNHVLKKDLNKTSVHHNKLQKKQVKDIIRVCPNEKYYKTTATTKYVKSNVSGDNGTTHVSRLTRERSPYSIPSFC